MKLANIYYTSQIKECVEMYISMNDSEIDFNKDFAIQNLAMAVRRKRFVRMLLDDSDKILAWIYADTGTNLHSTDKIIQQYYYCSKLKGTSAFKAVKILHQELINYAEQHKYEIIISPGSHMDESYVFTRILEKLGWIRRGYLAIYKTSHYCKVCHARAGEPG